MAILESFRRWADKVRIASNRLRNGLQSGWGYYDTPEITLMNRVKGVEEEKRENLYGSSVLGSRVINLNPKVLGGNKVMWATSAIHEAEHGVRSTDEDKATEVEFKFLGRLYKRSLETKNDGLARQALRGAVIAMKQRKRMVDAALRGGDEGILRRSGFSDRATRLVMGV